jgi:hypothetical protein
MFKEALAKLAASPLAGHKSGIPTEQGSSIALYTSSPSASTAMLSVAFPGMVVKPLKLNIKVAFPGKMDMSKLVTFAGWAFWYGLIWPKE